MSQVVRMILLQLGHSIKFFFLHTFCMLFVYLGKRSLSWRVQRETDSPLVVGQLQASRRCVRGQPGSQPVANQEPIVANQ